MDISELRALLGNAGLPVKTEKRLGNETGNQIRLKNGAVINLFDNGNYNVQGKNQPSIQKLLDEASGSIVADGASPATSSFGKKVFLVHGHDTGSREQLELILHKLGLDPFVLANTAGGGLTIIEALEAEIGPRSGARFGIVLMTPDDIGYAKADASNPQPRARQNVVLEMGMLISAIGRRNVAILKKGHIEVPSDAQGLLYIPFNAHVKETVPKLVDRLGAAGFSLELGKIANASA